MVLAKFTTGKVAARPVHSDDVVKERAIAMVTEASAQVWPEKLTQRLWDGSAPDITWDALAQQVKRLSNDIIKLDQDRAERNTLMKRLRDAMVETMNTSVSLDKQSDTYEYKLKLYSAMVLQNKVELEHRAKLLEGFNLLLNRFNDRKLEFLTQLLSSWNAQERVRSDSRANSTSVEDLMAIAAGEEP